MPAIQQKLPKLVGTELGSLRLETRRGGSTTLYRVASIES
jgi:hypothetical protein